MNQGGPNGLGSFYQRPERSTEQQVVVARRGQVVLSHGESDLSQVTNFMNQNMSDQFSGRTLYFKMLVFESVPPFPVFRRGCLCKCAHLPTRQLAKSKELFSIIRRQVFILLYDLAFQGQDFGTH